MTSRFITDQNKSKYSTYSYNTDLIQCLIEDGEAKQEAKLVQIEEKRMISQGREKKGSEKTERFFKYDADLIHSNLFTKDHSWRPKNRGRCSQVVVVQWYLYEN